MYAAEMHCCLCQHLICTDSDRDYLLPSTLVIEGVDLAVNFELPVTCIFLSVEVAIAIAIDSHDHPRPTVPIVR